MYDTSGVYRDTLQSIAGCDSIATLNLTIRPLNYTIADTMRMCWGRCIIGRQLPDDKRSVCRYVTECYWL